MKTQHSFARAVIPLAASIVALATTAVLAGPAKGSDGKEEAVTLTVSPHVLFVGGGVMGVIRLEPDPQNRSMRVEVDGGDYFSSSTVQLEGEAAPILYERRWKGLPAGKYRVHVAVMHASGEPHTTYSEFTVMDPRDERPPE